MFLKSKIFTDSRSKTSGYRFFFLLKNYLNQILIDERFNNVILFNISAPLSKIIIAKIFLKKIIIRVDSLYFDLYDHHYSKKFNSIVQSSLNLLFYFTKNHNLISFIANLIDQNYKGFVKLFFANILVYQSKFCKELYSPIFDKKKSFIILNGFTNNLHLKKKHLFKEKKIVFVTVFDGNRKSKRIIDLIHFIIWLNKSKKINTSLNLIGYKKNFLHEADRLINANKLYFNCTSPFLNFNFNIRKIITNSDIFITFTYRDGCPNVVIECMSFGLPVLAVNSGGIREIVGNAGELINIRDTNNYFVSHRFGYCFPKVNFDDCLKKSFKILNNYSSYQNKVKQRFSSDLNILNVSKKYYEIFLYAEKN